ncbi:hypothetical protein [Rhizobium sp. Nf11,1]|uniref:hypothetical protein n=1 Tax=Rhizobium sp. Nf11,1 TaxID=3404923 RepID=UPI003D3555BB
MAQTTKRCHWVPQSYLKAFAEKSTGNLYSPMGTDGRRVDALEKKFAEILFRPSGLAGVVGRISEHVPA